MKRIIFFIFIITTLLFADWSSFLKNLSNKESKKESIASSTFGSNKQIEAIKEALKESIKYATKKLSKTNGFLDNKKIKIPLPPSLQKAANIVSKYGGKSYVDSFDASINHAAEKAVPYTYDIFIDSIKNMSIDDARKLLRGKDGSITNYFKDKNYQKLYQKIYPLIKKSIRDIDVMKYYHSFKAYYERYIPNTSITKSSNSLLNMALDITKQTGLKNYAISLGEKSLDDYVTKKSIDGIFYIVKEEESKIRRNPLSSANSLVKKVFSNYINK